MIEAGSIIGGKYELVSQIGEGGMGVVWRARHHNLGHDIAVKFLTHLSSHSEQVVARFLDEARTAASVRHRNVVHILDFGIDPDGRPFMVMEFLEGESLADRLERNPPLSLAETTQTIGLTLSGLAAVHDRGIVHRDLKPENIFLTYDADGFFPKILDFGVSKDLGRDEEGSRIVKTRPGVLLGTPQYMSAEQARGLRDVDRRTDVYSMGVILYEMITGVRPFDAENVGDILVKVISGEHPTLGSVRPDLPRSMTDVVERAMATDRDARFPDAREMRNALFAAMATSRPAAFGITDPSGALNAELASAVVHALARSQPTPPEGRFDPTPRDARPYSASGVTKRVSTTSVDETIPFKVDSSDSKPLDRDSGKLPPPPPPGDRNTPSAQRTGDATIRMPDSGSLLASERALANGSGRSAKLAIGILFLGLVVVAAVEMTSPGAIARATGSCSRFGRSLFSQGMALDADAGVPAPGTNVDGGTIFVRFRPMPDDAVVTIGAKSFSPREIAEFRSDAGLVTIEVPRRDEEIDIRVEAPGFYPFENRRLASTNLSFRLRLRPIDAGVTVDESAPIVEPAPAPAAPERRRRHR